MPTGPRSDAKFAMASVPPPPDSESQIQQLIPHASGGAMIAEPEISM